MHQDTKSYDHCSDREKSGRACDSLMQGHVNNEIYVDLACFTTVSIAALKKYQLLLLK